MSHNVEIDPEPLSPEQVVAVAREGARVSLSDKAVSALISGRRHVESLADSNIPAYGMSTGFGALAVRRIPMEMWSQLQLSLIRSHAAGTGAEVETDVTRAMMLLRLHTMATGLTGVRPVVAQTLAAVLNGGLTPVVREHGSLGCSGDLVPLAHVALALIGEGTVRDHSGTQRSAGDALATARIKPLELAAKDGLALINGTEGMLGMLVLACHDLAALLQIADIAAAMSVEALLASDHPFATEVMALRPHPGPAASADNLRRLLRGSAIVESRQTLDCIPLQDAFSLRCAPQVAGAARDTLAHASRVAACELASTTDNPVVTRDGQLASNGNFHGAPLSYALDFLAIAAADVASISERRTDRLLDANRSHGLPAFLAANPGIDSGYMIAQYTQAAIVSDLKRLAVPASVDSIPSSAMQEDHVSMGWSAGRKLLRALDGLTRVLAIEVLVAARAIDLRAPHTPAPGIGSVLGALRDRVAGPGSDRFVAPEIDAVVKLVTSGSLVRAAEGAIGPLG